MRRNSRVLVVIAFAAAMVSGSAGLGAQGDDLARVPRISQAEFKRLLATGALVVLDTRDAGSYANGHIPGAISMPLDQIEKQAAQLKGEKRPIVTYCA